MSEGKESYPANFVKPNMSANLSALLSTVNKSKYIQNICTEHTCTCSCISYIMMGVNTGICSLLVPADGVMCAVTMEKSTFGLLHGP